MNTLSSITGKLKGIRMPRYGEEARPVRDWLVLILASALLLTASALWNAFFFVDAISQEAAASRNGKAVTVDRARMDAVEKAFQTRAEEQARYRSEYRFVDPSL